MRVDVDAEVTLRELGYRVGFCAVVHFSRDRFIFELDRKFLVDLIYDREGVVHRRALQEHLYRQLAQVVQLQVFLQRKVRHFQRLSLGHFVGLVLLIQDVVRHVRYFEHPRRELDQVEHVDPREVAFFLAEEVVLAEQVRHAVEEDLPVFAGVHLFLSAVHRQAVVVDLEGFGVGVDLGIDGHQTDEVTVLLLATDQQALP